MKLIKQDARLRLSDFINHGYKALLLLLCVSLCQLQSLYGVTRVPETITYYLHITDFVNSFIDIPTVTDITPDSTTIASSYLAGRAPIYDVNNMKAGICSASFLNMQTPDGVFTDISNYISADNGLIVTWFTPTTLINLELDSLVHSMITECIVEVTTKVGFSPYFGQTFDLVVSSDDQRIYFQFSRRRKCSRN